MITSVPPAPPRRPPAGRRRWPWALLLAAASVLVVALLAVVLPQVGQPSGGQSAGAGSALPAGALLPGHQPDKVYLGFSSPEERYDQEVRRVGEPTIRRGRYLGIEEVDVDLATMRRSLAEGRLPWTSFSADWKDVAAGRHDDELRARFAGFRALPGPALSTFAHEPVGDGNPADFVAAWTHILDLADEEGTGQVSLVPIMNGYVWGQRVGWTDEQIAEYLPADLLDRWPLVGVDVYHGATRYAPGEPPASRLESVLEWADRQGVPLLAIGEIGVHDPATWRETWATIEDNADRFMAVSYFNSQRNLREGVDWYLRGPTLRAYQESLASPTVAHLRDLDLPPDTGAAR